MTQTWMQRAFKPIRDRTPQRISELVRSVGTAVLTPIWFSRHTGHWKSSFQMLAVSSAGSALPWYTYPCIDFLKYRTYETRSVLEFGAGQSTLWWAERAARVVALEGDATWVRKLEPRVPDNVHLELVADNDPIVCVAEVERALEKLGIRTFDVVVIDGLWRYELISIAERMVARDGIIICDNSEGYQIRDGFADRRFARVDFFGHAPGVVLPHCTSIFFNADSFAFRPDHPIPTIAAEG